MGDTRKPFVVNQTFHAPNGSLTKLENVLIQGNSTFEFDVCSNQDYLQRMTQSLTKVKMVFQLWGDSFLKMSWLDIGACLGSCNHDSVFSVADISITPLTSEPLEVLFT